MKVRTLVISYLPISWGGKKNQRILGSEFSVQNSGYAAVLKEMFLEKHHLQKTTFPPFVFCAVNRQA